MTCQLSARVADVFFFYIFLFTAHSLVQSSAIKRKIIPPPPPPTSHFKSAQQQQQQQPSPPPSPPPRLQCYSHSHSHAAVAVCRRRKILSKENGAVVDCYKCMIGGECLLACRVIIIFVFAISRAHTILFSLLGDERELGGRARVLCVHSIDVALQI